MTSNERIIEILFKLYNNQSITITKLIKEYGVNKRTIQRDVATIKQIALSFNGSLDYDPDNKSYSLTLPNQLTFESTLALTKILLASRAFSKEEITSLINTLINLNKKEDSNSIEKLIKNELTFYKPLQHNQNLLAEIKRMNQFINDKKLITINYQKNDNSEINRTVLPVSIFFSEYYFYVICYEPDKNRYINLRLDRFLFFKTTNQKYEIPYKEKLEETKLREKMLFMYSGKEKDFTFKYTGIVEAALDKFPNSKVIETYKDSSVLIKATAHDTGTIMWLLSQGSRVEVVHPPSLIKDIRNEIAKMNSIYNVDK
ncbi:helix-turn-helix transcriptional regulator [Vagococcus carniphilus]|uniref:helix-turn-helix transcriptional regulator n=1 Tax=Vagococcus carniphilus TaxID=218144 RepID=UPI002892595F|nr:WYL domain-containing protein [Vagococcus carniphilus]MDT2864240.1 WYL domain-containing protein [Vagococcus carniphilus]